MLFLLRRGLEVVEEDVVELEMEEVVIVVELGVGIVIVELFVSYWYLFVNFEESVIYLIMGFL